jgi:hypothetical protein
MGAVRSARDAQKHDNAFAVEAQAVNADFIQV